MQNDDESSDAAARGERSFADVVHDELLDRLTTGRLAAGVRLNINSLAREFGVSPTPVREALSRLESSGTVLRAEPRGYVTAPLLGSQAMDELMEARLHIEGCLAELAAREQGERLVDKLEAAIERQILEHEVPGADRRLSEEFHLVLADAAGNRFLREAYLSLGGHIERFRVQAVAGSFDHEAAIVEHREIIDAVRRADPRAAREAMTRHLEQSRARSQRDIRAASGSGG